MFKHIAATCCLLAGLISFSANANINTGRFGFGVSNQAATNFSAVSFKVHLKPKFAIGGLAGVSTGSDGGHAFGLKIYQAIVLEQNLMVYGGLFGAILRDKSGTGDTSGFQGDLSLGAEFFFQGLEHIGFSFEAGVRVKKLDDFVFETNALSIVQSAIHFYL